MHQNPNNMTTAYFSNAAANNNGSVSCNVMRMMMMMIRRMTMTPNPQPPRNKSAYRMVWSRRLRMVPRFSSLWYRLFVRHIMVSKSEVTKIIIQNGLVHHLFTKLINMKNKPRWTKSQRSKHDHVMAMLERSVLWRWTRSLRQRYNNILFNTSAFNSYIHGRRISRFPVTAWCRVPL